MARLAGWFRKMSRPPEEVRADNLRHWASSIPGTVPIAETKARARCKVAGVVQTIRIDPREGRGSVEATITDGSASLVARFLGRQSLSGIRLGAGLIIEGMPASGGDGDLVVLNPEYQLVPGPEHE